jgi:hypothetical protein
MLFAALHESVFGTKRKHRRRVAECPLAEEEQTSNISRLRSAFDPDSAGSAPGRPLVRPDLKAAGAGPPLK